MGNQINVLLPKLGESIHSATVVRWFKQVGESVRLDEPLLEVSTDKVNSEIPSPAAGILVQVHAQLDQELPVGALLAVIDTAAAVVSSTPAPAPQSCASAPLQEQGMQTVYSPALLRIAAENGIDMIQLQKIPGTGMGGRVTKQDLEHYIENSKPEKAPCPLRASASQEPVERVKLSGMRKAIAENMVRSFYEAPHATLITEIDITAIMHRIQQEKESFSAQYGCKLTITTFIAHAIAKALQAFPLINSSLDGDTIVMKKFVNLGIAVSVDQGLFVPVVKQAQTMQIPELAQAISAISLKAREHKLQPDDVKDGTITLTNFGMSGVQIGVPIIRYPEVAIIGVGAVCKRVVPLESEVLAIRSMVHISLTFDHRVLDGMYGCGFLNAVKTHLESEVLYTERGK